MDKLVRICFAFVMLFQPVVLESMRVCNEIDGKLACCTGYKLNPERNECILCDRGFRGKNCDTKCPYRTYGDSCQSLCNCNITYCDHVNGCTVSSEESFSKEFIYKTVTKDLINRVNINESSFSATVENTTIFYYPKKTHSKMSFT
nr:N-acetylglucosamine-1-phosphodiester alpha-N-acetylglucosaminidase-like [Crassostrea gigas]